VGCKYIENISNGLDLKQIKSCLVESIKDKDLKKVLLIPPDITRSKSGAGQIVSLYYEMLKNVHLDILPALGTHVPMTREEQISFFGDSIPTGRFLIHDWRNHVTKIGEIPGEFIKEVSGGLIDSKIDVEISNYLLDPSYDLILSIGQVVPHEVVGMANYTKNIVIGCGGSKFINSSHMLGAVYGLEKIMGKVDSPVRDVFDYAQEKFLKKLPLEYILTVTAGDKGSTKIIGLYTGKEREGYERAAKLSQKHNLTVMDSPIETCVVWLDEHEFHSTWIGNKAIYRTRKAMADGGHLIILAPGITKFGEDKEIDRLIRKFGFIGREEILKLSKTEPELKNNLSAAAHLIHASPDGRFKVTYATDKMSKEEIEGVGFNHMSLSEAFKIYNHKNLSPGYNTLDNGEKVFYIENPALGLWTTNDRI